MPILDKGLDQAETANEQIKAERPKLYYRPEMLTIRDGDRHYLHILTEHTHTLSAQVHQFMPTKAQPKEYTGTRWAKSMWAICMLDKMYRLPDPADPSKRIDEFEQGYGDCYLHNTYKGKKDPKFGKDLSWPTFLTFGLAVPQIPINRAGQPAKPGEGAVSFVDEMVTFRDPKTKELLQIPKIVVVAQRYETLWHPVKATAYIEPHTITDKVFLVERKGQQDKDWNVMALGTTPDCKPGTDHWKAYDEAIALLGFDFQAWFLSHGEQDHYDRWFVPGATPKDGYARRDDEEEESGAAASGASTAASAGAAEVDQDKLDGFRASLSARGGEAVVIPG